MKQKKSLLAFTADLRNELQYFEQAMRDFSPRNEREWFKLLADYLHIENPITERDTYWDPVGTDDDWP